MQADSHIAFGNPFTHNIGHKIISFWKTGNVYRIVTKTVSNVIS
jgi:hypothetical protein